MLRVLAAGRSALMLGGVILITLAAAGYYITSDSGSRVQAATGGPEFVFNIKGGACDDAVRPTECDVSLAAQFTLSVDALGVPSNGYIVLSSFINFGPHLTYLPTGTAQEEIVWPDCLDGGAVRFQIPFPPLPGDEVVLHSCLTDPGVVSTFVGNIVELDFLCGPSDSSTLVRLIPRGELAEFQGTFLRDSASAVIIPKIGNLLVNCGAGGPLVTSTPAPTDTPTATPVQQPTPTFPPPKANDNFADAMEISITPFINKEDTTNMTIEPGEPTSCGGLTNSVWYSLTPATDLLIEADTAGSSFNSPVMAVYTGDTLGTLMEIGCNQRLVFIAEAGVTYYFQLGACAESFAYLFCPDEGGSLQFSLESGPVPQMVLNAADGLCDHPITPTRCDLPIGEKFALTVDVLDAPFLGYVLAQAYLEFGEYLPGNIEDPDAVDDPETTFFIEGPGPCDDGVDNGGDGDASTHVGRDRFDADCVSTGVVHKPTTAHADEFPWPDCSLAIRIVRGPGATHLGCITGAVPPLDVSYYEGSLIELSMSCSEETSSTDVRLLPLDDSVAGTSGAAFTSPQGDQIAPYVSGLTINCVAPVAVGGVAFAGELRGVTADEAQAPAGSGMARNALVPPISLVLVAVAGAWLLRRRVNL